MVALGVVLGVDELVRRHEQVLRIIDHGGTKLGGGKIIDIKHGQRGSADAVGDERRVSDRVAELQNATACTVRRERSDLGYRKHMGDNGGPGTAAQVRRLCVIIG